MALSVILAHDNIFMEATKDYIVLHFHGKVFNNRFMLSSPELLLRKAKVPMPAAYPTSVQIFDCAVYMWYRTVSAP